MLPPTTLSGSVEMPGDEEEVDDREDEESMMELERPGEEKKKRWDAKTVEKSGVEEVV